MKTRPFLLLRVARGAVVMSAATVVVSVPMFAAPLTSGAAVPAGAVAQSSSQATSNPAPATARATSPAPGAHPGCTTQADFSDVVGQGPLCQSGRQFVVRLRNTHDVTVAPPDTIAGLHQAGAISSPPASTTPSMAADAPAFSSACVTNGQHQRVVLIYAHFAGQADNVGGAASDIDQQFNQVDSNYINYDASTYFGITMHLFVECNSSLQLDVHDLALSTPINGANFSTIVSDAQAAGYCVSGGGGGCSAAGAAHYWIWTDGNPTSGYAGQSSVIGDDSTGTGNAINSADEYSVNYGFNAGNNGASIFAHENGHAMGAVQLSAPDSTGAWHCTDGRDVMCYNDGGPNGNNYTTADCGNTPNGTAPFDCKFNDYFNPNPAPGSYLSNHWDIASSYNEWIDFQLNSSTTTLSAPSSAVYTQPITLSANIAGSGGPTPSGTVQFFDGSTSLGSASIGGSGSAQLQTSGLSVGSHSITATYSGSGEYNGSTSNPVSISISQAASQTHLATSANPAGAADPVTLTATVGPVSPATGNPGSGHVTFTSNGSSLGTASVNASGQATLSTSWPSVGSYQVQATYNGSTGFGASSSSTLTETILTGVNLTLTSSPAGSGTPTVGTSITLRATVTPQSGSGTPTGTVAFSDGSAPLGNPVPLNSSGVATLTTTHFGPGSNPLSATYSGDPNYAPATGTTTQVVSGGGLQVVMTPSNQQLVFFQGTNRDLYEDWFTPGLGWSGPVDWSVQLSSPGGMASAPAVTLTPTGQQLVFWRGTNNDMWEAWFTPGIGWMGPVDYSSRLGGSANVASTPQIELTPTGQQLVFWEGTNHDLWEAWFTPGLGWAGPVDYTLKLHGGATVASTPVVVLTPGGQQLVFWQGVNNGLWEAWFTPGLGWSGPVDFSAALQAPDNVASSPSVTLTGGGQQLVFWQGTNNDLWEAWFTPGIGWSGPVDLSSSFGSPGSVGSAPAVLTTGASQLVFWTGTNGHLWEAWFSGSWAGPADLTPSLTPGTAVGTPPSATLTDDGQQVVFWETPQVTLGEWWFDSNGAHGPATLSAA